MGKKVGIITLSDSKENYGQILQAYALSTFLNKLGNEAFLIRIKHQEYDERSFVEKTLQRLKSLSKPLLLWNNIREKKEMNRQHSLMKKSIMLHDRHFEDFISKNIPNTNIWYNDVTIKNTPPDADAFVCGSDQIWGSDLPYMYLEFALSSQIKISYAASFGGIIPSSDIRGKIADYLSSFRWVSVRENSGKQICQEIGVENVDVVPDPTLLLDKSDYKRLYESQKIKEKYLFLYLLGNRIPIEVSEIFKLAESRGLYVKYVTAHGRDDCYAKEYPSIEEWLQLIEESEYVITNSYHCTIFSLLYHKRFLSLPIEGIRSRMNTRIEELLNKYNCSNRLYKGNLEVLFQEIDYTVFDKRHEEDRHNIERIISNKLEV